MQARFENGIYRDCKWCLGKGCLSCPAEADKEYKRQFPDGPKPILTITKEEMERDPDGARKQLSDVLKSVGIVLPEPIPTVNQPPKP